jgi:hypothetical protein
MRQYWWLHYANHRQRMSAPALAELLTTPVATAAVLVAPHYLRRQKNNQVIAALAGCGHANQLPAAVLVKASRNHKPRMSATGRIIDTASSNHLTVLLASLSAPPKQPGNCHAAGLRTRQQPCGSGGFVQTDHG